MKLRLNYLYYRKRSLLSSVGVGNIQNYEKGTKKKISQKKLTTRKIKIKSLKEKMLKKKFKKTEKNK